MHLAEANLHQWVESNSPPYLEFVYLQHYPIPKTSNKPGVVPAIGNGRLANPCPTAEPSA